MQGLTDAGKPENGTWRDICDHVDNAIHQTDGGIVMSIGIDMQELANQTGARKTLIGKEMYCPKCGKAIPTDSVFCQECGTKLWKTTDTPIQNVSHPIETKTVQVHSDTKKEKGWVFPVVFCLVLVALGGSMVWLVSSEQTSNHVYPSSTYSSVINTYSTDYDPADVLDDHLVGASIKKIRTALPDLTYHHPTDSYSQQIEYFGKDATLTFLYEDQVQKSIIYSFEVEKYEFTKILYEIQSKIKEGLGTPNAACLSREGHADQYTFMRSTVASCVYDSGTRIVAWGWEKGSTIISLNALLEDSNKPQIYIMFIPATK